MLKKDFLQKKRKGGNSDARFLGPYKVVKKLYIWTDEKTVRATGAHLKPYFEPNNYCECFTCTCLLIALECVTKLCFSQSYLYIAIKVKSLYKFCDFFNFSNLYFSTIKKVLVIYRIQYHHYPLLFQLLESARLFYIYNFVYHTFYFSNLYFSMIKHVLVTYRIQYHHYPLLFQLLESARLFYIYLLSLNMCWNLLNISKCKYNVSPHSPSSPVMSAKKRKIHL